MTTYKNTLAGTGIALMALVSLALPFSFAHAADADWGYDTFVPDSGGDSWGYDTFVPDSGGDTWGYDTFVPDSGSDTWGYDTFVPDSGYSSSYGGGSGFSMPSFGTSAANSSYRASNSYPTFNTPKSTPSNTTITTNTNTCTNNSCNYVDNSVTDNSIKVADSYNNVNTKSEKKSKNREYDYPTQDCYNSSYGYNDYGYNNNYNQGYNNNYGYNSNQGYSNCYTAPIAYNTTPYVTLSAMPYTGFDLGPMGTVLYWTFLVLWCLGAAYLIVVKRVQNKLVSFLNGFLFGTTSGATFAHATHTPAAHTKVASAPVTEGIDPFIASQIAKRS